MTHVSDSADLEGGLSVHGVQVRCVLWGRRRRNVRCTRVLVCVLHDGDDKILCFSGVSVTTTVSTSFAVNDLPWPFLEKTRFQVVYEFFVTHSHAFAPSKT